jgi:glycosyltransferase involved in cell wall biosynthesis
VTVPKPRIAFHLFDLAPGGVERMRIALAGELLSRGWHVDFLLARAEGELMPLVPEGVRVINLNVNRSIAAVRPLMRYLREEPPAALFSSLGHQNVAAILAKQLARSSVWLGVMQHNALSEQARTGITMGHRLLPWLYRATLWGADKVLAVSCGVAEDMAMMTGYPRDRIGVLYNPAYPKNADAMIAAGASHPFYDSGLPVLIAVGRLHQQKGFDTLIRAFALAHERRAVRLLILGVGPDEAALRALVAELNLTHAVDLVGFQSHPMAWIAKSDLFLMSSRYEGFGNVLVEALAAGTPVISTNCRFGPSEILEDGRWGTLVPVDAPIEMASAILAALDASHDPALLRARAKSFSVASVTDAYLATAFSKREMPYV